LAASSRSPRKGPELTISGQTPAPITGRFFLPAAKIYRLGPALFTQSKFINAEGKKVGNSIFANPSSLSVSLSQKVHHFLAPSRVARWFVFKPNIWVNFGGPLNSKCWYIL
jgi:hypothetical protein